MAPSMTLALPRSKPPGSTSSDSSRTSQRRSSMWGAAKGAVKKVGGFFGGEGEENHRTDADEKRSFEAALSSPPDPIIRARNTSGVGPQLPVAPAQGIVEARRGDAVVVARPAVSGEVSEGWERIEPGKSLPENGRKTVHDSGSTSRKDNNDSSTRKSQKHDDRRRQDLDVERRLAKCESEKQVISNYLQRTVEKLGDAETRERVLQAEVQRLVHELETAKRDLHLAEECQRDAERRQQDAEAHQQTTARLLGETAAELRAANLFLTKTDALSSADVVAMVDSLNAKNMQLAAFMADTLGENGRGQEMETQGSTEERVFNLRAVGEQLVQFLRDHQTQRLDPMAVQIALQLCLADTCDVVIQAWHPGVWKGEDILRELYSSIRRNTIAPVCGRWRAITRSQTKNHEYQSPVLLYFAQRLADVLSLAGWPAHHPENRDFLSRFEERLKQIVALSLRIHKAIGEEITSTELRPGRVRPNTKFDHEQMDDAFPDDEKIPAEEMERSLPSSRVASGTTGLGLWMIVDKEITILRKPKVVRLSALGVMLGGH